MMAPALYVIPLVLHRSDGSLRLLEIYMSTEGVVPGSELRTNRGALPGGPQENTQTLEEGADESLVPPTLYGARLCWQNSPE